MKRKTFALIFGLLIIASLAACQPQQAPLAAAQQLPPNPYAPPHQLNAQGVGVVYLTPDVAYISVGVQTSANDVTTALNDNNAQATSIANTLKELGVAEKDIQTSAFSVYPQQDYGPDGQPAAMKYVVNNTVFITVRDLNNMGKMLDAVVRSGANTIYGITFDVENKDSAFSDARKMAIDNAKKNAAELAQAAGIELGDLVSLNVYQTSGPSPINDGKGGAMAAAGAPAPVAAGQMTITINAEMAFAIK